MVTEEDDRACSKCNIVRSGAVKEREQSGPGLQKWVKIFCKGAVRGREGRAV